MTPAEPLVAIILVNFNTPQETKECVESLLSLNDSRFTYQLIIVDNGSKQELHLPKKMMSDKIEILRMEANIGFTGGNNLGISHAVKTINPDYFVLLNSDTVVDPDFIQTMLDRFNQEPELGICSSKIYFESGFEFYADDYSTQQQGKIIWYAGGEIDWQNLVGFHRGVDELDRGQFDHLRYCAYATGCSFMLKREVVEEVGILDKRYFLYLEDLDWSIRAVRKGYKVGFCPESIVWHKNAGSTQGSGSVIHQYYQTRNRLLFFLKYGRWRTKITAIGLILRKLIYGNPTERKAVRDYLLGTFGKQPVI